MSPRAPLAADRLAAYLLALVMALPVTGCRSRPEREGGALVPPEFSSPPAILLVVVDTLGAKHVGCYGSADVRTPRLDGLAADGVLFERAYSPAPWTQPAVASLLVSKLPSDHGVTRLFDVLPEREKSIAERLSDRGYATAAVVSHFLLKKRFGYGQGFDRFDDSTTGGELSVTGSRTTDAALRLIDTRPSDRPFFLLVHFFDPHYVYHHHPEHDRTRGYRGWLSPAMPIWELRDSRPRLTVEDVSYLTGLYHEEVAYTDAEVGRLVDHFKASTAAQDALILVTADHGEELMERGWIGHTRTLHDELLHVPMIAWWSNLGSPRRVSEPVSLLDVAPTLLEVSGPTGNATADESTMSGRSLFTRRSARSDRHAGRLLFSEVSFVPDEATLKLEHEKVAFKTAVTTRDWKVIHDLAGDRWEGFDLRSDPSERLDLLVAGRIPEELERLQKALVRWEASRGTKRNGRSSVSPEPEELGALKSLGYLR